MNRQHFENEIARLSECFGKGTVYNSSRVRLIFLEVKELSESCFTRMVDEFIGCMRQAPLLPEFREATSRERERSAFKKKQDEEDHNIARDETSILTEDDRKMLFGVIIDRMHGRISDEKWESNNQLLKTIPSTPKKGDCRNCDGTKYIWIETGAGLPYSRRCECY